MSRHRAPDPPSAARAELFGFLAACLAIGVGVYHAMGWAWTLIYWWGVAIPAAWFIASRLAPREARRRG